MLGVGNFEFGIMRTTAKTKVRIMKQAKISNLTSRERTDKKFETTGIFGMIISAKTTTLTTIVKKNPM